MREVLAKVTPVRIALATSLMAIGDDLAHFVLHDHSPEGVLRVLLRLLSRYDVTVRFARLSEGGLDVAGVYIRIYVLIWVAVKVVDLLRPLETLVGLAIENHTRLLKWALVWVGVQIVACGH